nr:hypothetical protein [Tanacetum cinerariifolium]
MAKPNEYIFVTQKKFLADNKGRMVEKSFLEIQGTFVVKIRDNTFNGIIRENKFKHIDNFLEVVGPLKIKGLSQDRFRLSVFPISLAGQGLYANAITEKDYDPYLDINRIFSRNYKANNAGSIQDNKKEYHDPSICNIRIFEMMKYLFDADDEYIAIKEREHSDHSRTNVDALYAVLFLRFDLNMSGLVRLSFFEEVKIQLPKILPKAVSALATPVIERNVTESLEAVVLASKPLPLIQDHRGHQVIPQDFFITNNLEYQKGGDLSRRYSTSVTKTKATTYEIKWIEDLGDSGEEEEDDENNYVDKSDGNDDDDSDDHDADIDDERTESDRDEIPDPILTNVEQTAQEEEEYSD